MSLMLGDDALKQYLEGIKVPEAGRILIADVRSSEPARLVQGRARNVRVRYPSRKMGRTIQAESHTIEYPFAVLREHDDATFEFWDQPFRRNITYITAGGRKLNWGYTPDYLVLNHTHVLIAECKSTAELEEWLVADPNRFCKDKEGRWRCPPAEEYFQLLGFQYKVFTEGMIDEVLATNCRFLEPYLTETSKPVPEDICEKAVGITQSFSGITLADLRQKLLGVAAVDQVNTLIATEKVHVNLSAAFLTNPSEVVVCANQEQAAAIKIIHQNLRAPIPGPASFPIIKPGVRLLWDSTTYEVRDVGSAAVKLANETFVKEITIEVLQTLIAQGQITPVDSGSAPDVPNIGLALEMVRNTPEGDIREANRRFRILTVGYMPGEEKETPRTIRRWRACLRDAEQLYGMGYVGLLSKRSRCGRRPLDLPPSAKKLLEDTFDNDYGTSRAINTSAFICLAKAKAAELSVHLPCDRLLRDWVKGKAGYKVEIKRVGHTGAAHMRPWWHGVTKGIRESDWVWGRAYIDHTEVDFHVVIDLELEERNGHKTFTKKTDRVWASALIDAASRRVLAIVFSFDGPSQKTCMLLLRECVRRWGRLPLSLMLDNAKEFTGNYFACLCAQFYITVLFRPPARPEFGNELERWFKTQHQMFSDQLTGNSKLMKDVKKLTAEVKPDNTATYTPKLFTEAARKFAYEIYDQRPHSTLGRSPEAHFELNFRKHGDHSALIPFTEAFRIITLPSVKDNELMIRSGKGIHYSNVVYWNELFANRALDRRRVPVRYDPFDRSYIYAFVDSEWVLCTNENLQKIIANVPADQLNALGGTLEERNRRIAAAQQEYAVKVGLFLSDCEKVALEEYNKLRRATQDLNDSSIRDRAVAPRVPGQSNGTPKSNGPVLVSPFDRQSKPKNLQTSRAIRKTPL